MDNPVARMRGDKFEVYNMRKVVIMTRDQAMIFLKAERVDGKLRCLDSTEAAEISLGKF